MEGGGTKQNNYPRGLIGWMSNILGIFFSFFLIWQLSKKGTGIDRRIAQNLLVNSNTDDIIYGSNPEG